MYNLRVQQYNLNPRKCVLKMILLILILLVPQISCITEINYDEDISFPVPEVILNHSPINEPAPEFLTRIHNCACRQHPKRYVVCCGQRCNEFPATLNISVPLFKMKVSSITILKRDDLELYSNLEVLEIESNYLLDTIEPGIFKNMFKLLNLTISFNERLNFLADNVFEGLVNLSTLSLQKNGFTKVLDITISLSPMYLPVIFLLKLDENIFHEIGQHEFHPMNGTQLQQLNMVLCEIEYIHPESLEPLKYLNTLRVGENHLNSSVLTKVIERSTDLGIPLDNLNLYGMGFRRKPPLDLLRAVGRSGVRYLHLIVDHFDQLEDDAFPYMPNLLQLSLRGNHIMEIASNAFRRIPKLESLLLTANRLVQIPQAVLLPTLKELDIAGNTYQSSFYVSNEMFKNMTKLSHLSLAYNNICFLTKSTFVGLNNLINLNLKNASLTLIRSGTFLPLGNLTLLNLINNPFPRYMFLKVDIFQGLNNLEVLLLGGCSIRNLSTSLSIFTYTPSLRYLGLERNELFTIGHKQFAPLVKLQSLNINENKLASWNKRILGTNSSLKTLSANSNKISFITTAMLEDWTSLEKLYLDGNPFTCDCSLYPAVLWYRSHSKSIKYYSDDAMIASCVSPEFWRHTSIITFLLSLSEDRTICENTGQLSLPVIICLGILFSLLVIIGILGYAYRYDMEYWFFKIKLGRSIDEGIYDWDVYVSVSSSDEWFITELITKLEPNLKLCLPERDLIPGDSKPAAVAAAVASSRRLLLVVSQEYTRCSWCKWETQLVARRKPIVVQLQEVGSNGSALLRYLLRTRIYLLWPQEEDRQVKEVFWQKLRVALAREQL